MDKERKQQLDTWYDTKFWPVFSNKKAKKKGREALYKLDPSDEELEQIYENTLARNRYRKWSDQHGKFFAIDPYPERYFRDERWLDELPNCSTQDAESNKPLCECGNEATMLWHGKEHICTHCYVHVHNIDWKKGLYRQAVMINPEVAKRIDETQSEYNDRMQKLAKTKCYQPKRIVAEDSGERSNTGEPIDDVPWDDAVSEG